MNTLAQITWRQKLFQRPLLLSAVIFTAAFLLRIVAIEKYVTPDELIWVYRSVNFREAVRAGNWLETLQAGHPGVVTMWLGTLGMSLQLLINPADQQIYEWITKLAWLTPDNMIAFQQLNTFLTSGRLAIAVVNSLGIVLVFWSARRLQGDLFALLVIAFLILDPFLAGLSGILHVDGLATTFATLSLLMLCLSLMDGSRSGTRRSALPYSALSGAAAALAVLSKSPALLLAPVAALLYLSNLWRDQEIRFAARLKKVFFLGLAWFASFILTLFLIFPALWTSPLQVLQTTSSNASRHVEEALRPTFFMGDVAFDHGPLFYPIALAWRMGPVVMIGLIIFLGLFISPKWRRQLPKLFSFALALWIVIFIAGINLAAKKFDRYALPAVPELVLLAAVGWSVWLRPGDRAKHVLLVSLLILQMAYLVFVLPYPLAAYNLLLGGPYTAQYVLPVGWGEGVSAAGKWLSENLDVESQSAISGIAPSLAPFFSGETLLAEEDNYEEANYLILTANSRQVDPLGALRTTEVLNLIHTIRYGGLEQSWIFENPQPERIEITVDELANPVVFGSRMQLIGQGISANAEDALFTARWDRQQSVDRFLVKLALLDSNGHKWSSLETALLNEVYFYPEHWRFDETPTVTYKLELPVAIPPGKYGIELSLLDETTGSALPVTEADGDFQGVSYHAGELNLAGANATVDTKALDMSAAHDIAWAGDSLRLIGYGELPERVISGGELILDLFWQSTSALPDGAQLLLQIADEDPVILPLSRFDSGLWRPGTILQEKYLLHIPPSMAAGEAAITVRPVFSAEDVENGYGFSLGQVEIQATDRIFALPEGIAIPLYADFEPGIQLRGADAEDTVITPGENLRLVLYWQAQRPTDVPLTAFVHIVDDQGEIVAQADRWPGGLPSNIWAQNQVIIDEYTIDLPADIQPGNYEVLVGLYTAGSGQRVPVVDAAGQAYAEHSVPLPLKVKAQP